MTEHVLGRLSAYIDGELAEAERLELAAHLRECPECEALRQELLRADRIAKETELAPAGYFDSLPGRIRERVGGAPRAETVAEAGSARQAAAPRQTAVPLRPSVAVPPVPGADAAEPVRSSGQPGRSTAAKPLRQPGGVPRPRAPLWGWAAAAGLLVALVTPLLLRERPRPAPSEADRPLAAGERQAPAAPGRAQQEAAAPQPTAPVPQQTVEPSQGRLADAARPEARSAAPSSAVPAAAPAAVPMPSAGAQVAVPPPRAAEQPAPGAPVASEAARAKRLAAAEEPSLRKSEADAEATLAAAAPPAPGPAVRGAVVAGRAGAADEAKDSAGESPYERLLARAADSAEQARALRAEWQALLPQLRGAQADEARVRAIEAGARAFRLGRDARDAQLARADAATYLARSDATQAARVRAALASLDR